VVEPPPPGITLVRDGRRAERGAIAGDDDLGRDAERLGGLQREDVRPRCGAPDDQARAQPREQLLDLPADELGVRLGEVCGAGTAAGVEDDHLRTSIGRGWSDPTRGPTRRGLRVEVRGQMMIPVGRVIPPCTTMFVER
jgi:hypothetical protein